MMNLIEQLRADYARFPHDQTYSLYAADVCFKDPMTAFCGLDRYKAMIQLIERFFLNCRMELHRIEQMGDTLHTEWTLRWNTPLPWKPAIAISGRSELKLNAAGLIVAHEDFWNCSRWDVLKQHFSTQ